MADYNNTNNNYQNRITTSGMTLFDENSTMLRLSYLDDSFSLIIGECQIADNGKRKYPQELRHPFIITMDRAIALNDHVIPKAINALTNNENYNGGVLLNRRKDALFEIRVENGDVYLVYHKEIDENCNPKNSFVFKCQKTDLIESYHVGSMDFVKSSVEGYFAIFCKYIEAGIFDMTGSSAHAFRKGNQYTTNHIFDYLKGIASKLGITIENQHNYNNNQSNSGFMNVPPETDDELPFLQENNSTSTELKDIIS